MNEISIEKTSDRFALHLSVAGNLRIIFSGKYGFGKSYFLENFFRRYEDKYYTVFLSPVNYVISGNEDIFELIKADILKSLFLSGKVETKRFLEKSQIEKMSDYVENNPLLLFKFLSKFLSKINPVVEAPIQLLESLRDLAKDYKTNVIGKNKEKTRFEEGDDFLIDAEAMIGSIYEYNYVTKLINSFLDEIDKSLKRVLIIDDFDRMDPEHIFRILNVFSAHHSDSYEGNKFKFDHIIIVCDIDNIRKIFTHKYGKGVDFDGYIDKFFSREIFLFGNKDSVQTYIEGVFKNKDNVLVGLLGLTFHSLVNKAYLSVRKLIKYNHVQIGINEFNLRVIRPSGQKFTRLPEFIVQDVSLVISSEDLQLLNYFKFMTIVYGGFDVFFHYLSMLAASEDYIDYSEWSEAIELLALQQHILTQVDDQLFFSIEKIDDRMHYNYPKIKFLDKSYMINLKWRADRPYSGKGSYFEEAKALEIDQPHKTKDLVKTGAIFVEIKNMALLCYEKGYIVQSDIYHGASFF